MRWEQKTEKQLLVGSRSHLLSWDHHEKKPDLAYWTMKLQEWRWIMSTEGPQTDPPHCPTSWLQLHEWSYIRAAELPGSAQLRLLTQRMVSKYHGHYFKSLSFRVVCYTALDNWYTTLTNNWTLTPPITEQTDFTCLQCDAQRRTLD